MKKTVVIQFDRKLLQSPRQFSEFLIAKTKKIELDTLNESVIQLFFKKKYVFIKCKTAVGSLKTIFQLMCSYSGQKSQNLPEDNLYLHFVKYFWNETRGYTFRVKVILVSKSASKLLKCEQECLWNKKNDPNCLNNTTEAYIPVYREETATFGWINKGSVLTFQKWKKKQLRLQELAIHVT